MTDITDQDRRDAREWAEDVAETFKYDDEVPRETRAAVNYILATVDAPEPTLAEEVKKGLLFRVNDTDAEGIKDALDLAARVEQIEQERDDLARARESQEKALHEHGRLLSEARAERDRLADEVESMTTQKEAADAASEENAVDDEGQAPTTLPDLADVKPGEPWLIRVGDREAVATRDGTSDEWPWSVAFFDGEADDVADKVITLITRLVPAPRVITDADELDRLAEGSIVRDRAGHAWERYPDEDWYSTEELDDGFSSRRLANYAGPVTVLWTPEETK